ncbi:Arc family DNA-binding protein [Stenotrophomonas maltophilia]|nr:Arc family DNA-binding protein [Stenotrophomonas maltophilia]HEL5571420.1 Arc family DNA-binding protein [Stenotrophomonas maltophilia]
MSQPEMIKTQLRLPADLHQRLVEFTGITGRSMNAEIVHRLEQSLNPMAHLGSMGLRAQIAAERELAQSTVEMLSRAVDELRGRIKSGGTGSYPRQAAGRSVEEALADAIEARDMFQNTVDAATVLLSELSIAEVKGEDSAVDEIRDRAEKWGLLVQR